jgi:SAM-dependent methyltransferase
MGETMSGCPVCGCGWSYDLFNPGPQPLSALGLPKSHEEAISRSKYQMDFVACYSCGHIYNRGFKYEDVPYETNSNLMYNNGYGWLQHIDDIIDWILQYKEVLKAGPVIDIGCGDGQFLKRLLEREPTLECIGYEPGIAANGITEFKVIQDYFSPSLDFLYKRPSLILCRHVLEHLPNPRDFVGEIEFWSMMSDNASLLFLEVPCIEKALRETRLSDFLYEHVSNFTTKSFKRLAELNNLKVHKIQTLYNDEVLAGMFQCGESEKPDAAKEFKTACNNLDVIQNKLLSIESPVYLWGGTGKSSSFLNIFKLDAERFPYVVDSDQNKVGKFVPGTGQCIQHSTWLKTQPVGEIIITTPWRAHDIYKEIKFLGIPHKTILVYYHNGLEAYENISSRL